MIAASSGLVAQDTPGSIRGVVTDGDFDVPLAGAQVTIIEAGRSVATSDQGHFVFAEVPAGRYTLAFTKEGYVRHVQPDVIVTAGSLTDVDAVLSGEVTEMDEVVVQDALPLDGATEAGLLQLRLDSPALMDSIGADLINRAGASDAAGALRLVAGASVQDGKSAVIRGLPDRYVSTQLNGVRLPTADEDKRAVELDQFPAAVIESIQVSKTFTPDQQGDASGGAVNVRLKGIPADELFVKFKSQTSWNSQVTGKSRFLTYRGGGVDFWGSDDGGRDQQLDALGGNWTGAVGVSRDDAPVDYKMSVSAGGRHEIADGVRVGGSASLFYERDSSYYDDGIDDSWWVTTPGGPMTPETVQGVPAPGGCGDYRTALFDVTRGKRSVQWGGLGAAGLETDNHSVNLSYLYTRTAEDVATLAEDTRGKQYFFPGFDPDDPQTPGHDEPDAAPYLRLETLEYTERSTGSFQVNGRHRFPFEETTIANLFTLDAAELDWVAAWSFAGMDQPDKRLFGSEWRPARQVGPITIPAFHAPYKPGANFNLGNLQRIWKEIDEDSTLFAINAKLPFKQWTGDPGYLKAGWFRDRVDRSFDQDSFSNFNDNATFDGEFEVFWSEAFPLENHPITASEYDVDYEGVQKIEAWYAMMDLPVISGLNLIGGVRLESTDIGIVNDAESLATWFPPGNPAPTQLNPGDADAEFRQDDVLPSIALEARPFPELTLRASYNGTIARQTFKELTPIIQQEYLGGSIFIGNPSLTMSAVDNWDLRADWTPLEGGLVSASWFRKDLEDPIEYVQKVGLFSFTTAVNYPEGSLEGFELEVRQDLGVLWEAVNGLSVGANATFIDSEVTLPDDEVAAFNLPNIMAPITKRDMTNAPEHLFNIFLTYELASTGTSFAIFYTLQGDTLLAGAGQSSSGNFVPSIYATQYDTLNLSLSQKLFEYFTLQFQAKNLTNADLETVYRSKYIDEDVKRTSYSDGIELSLSLSAEFKF